MFKLRLAAGLVLLLIAACSPAASTTTVANVPTGIATTVPTQPNSAPATRSPLQAVAQSTEDQPAWLSTPLVSAETGQTFRLTDFSGKTVYVELMASWCTNCRIQQGNVRTVKGQLSADDYQFVSLSVEPKDTTALMATYRTQYNYPWTFAIVPKDMLAALVEQFGQSVTNPTATPHFIISPEGAISQLSTGIKSADELTSALTAASGA
ncbi:MAG TPA: redoxin domain-containing protein [Phototrophicaceae bacterium]|nr:redoxin domain-containing protein [Phototrophicaceae bacterium]